LLFLQLLLIGSWILAGAPSPASAATPALSLPAQVGSKLFFDKTLSGSGQMSCASCHDPNHAYAPANALAVQLGGPNLSIAGTRAVPSLRYKDHTPPYSDLLDNPDGVSPPGPGGGFMQDGHAPTLEDQAQIPLLAANEMANASISDVVNKIRGSAYLDLFEQAFGSAVFDDTAAAFSDAMAALQAYQMEDTSFHPYTSKYDLYAGNKIGGTLTAAEARGLAVFSDANKGNCAACHYSGAGINGSVAVFTDFSFEAIGVPRNNDVPANRRMLGLPVSYDLGICNRADHPPLSSGQFCGMWKTPTLRNVATRKVFFHNGKFKSLSDVIHWYNTRDTNPELWYPILRGVVQKFDDVPTKYRGNIDTQAPLDGRPAGSQPAMSAQDMQDLEAFLNTLTDGYTPSPAP
jgi:cytochrome c peroxidase